MQLNNLDQNFKELFTSKNVLNTQFSDLPLIYIQYYQLFAILIYNEINTSLTQQPNSNNLLNLIEQYNLNNIQDKQKFYNVIIKLDSLSSQLSNEQILDRIDILTRLLNISTQIFNTTNVTYLQTTATANGNSPNFVSNIPNFINLINNLLILYINDANNIYANTSINNNTNLYYIIITILSICLIVSLYVNFKKIY
jgi:hypothetical protein